MKAVRVSNDFFVQLFFYLIPIRFYFSPDDVKMSEKDKTGNLTPRENAGLRFESSGWYCILRVILLKISRTLRNGAFFIMIRLKVTREENSQRSMRIYLQARK